MEADDEYSDDYDSKTSPRARTKQEERSHPIIP